MLLEIFLTLQVLLFVVFAVAFFVKSEWFWAITLVLAGVLIFSSYQIQQNIAVVNNQTVSNGGFTEFNYGVYHDITTDLTLSYLNIGIFGLSLVLFFADLWNNFKEHKAAQR